MTVRYDIIEAETGKVVHSITTDKLGSARDKFEDGLYRKVDFNRFWVDGPIVEKRAPAPGTLPRPEWQSGDGLG